MALIENGGTGTVVINGGNGNGNGNGTVWPTDSRIITQDISDDHNALDIAGNVGDPVYAPVSGKITGIFNQPEGYGLNIRLLTDDGRELIFAHLSDFGVSIGQLVGAGDQIGKIGSTGNSTGPHLHFEVREPGADIFNGGTSTISASDPYDFFGMISQNAGAVSRFINVATPTILNVLLGETEVHFEAGEESKIISTTSKGDVLVSTPFGDTLIDIPWEQIITITIGLILVLIALNRMAGRQAGDILVAGGEAIIPGAGIVTAALE